MERFARMSAGGMPNSRMTEILRDFPSFPKVPRGNRVDGRALKKIGA